MIFMISSTPSREALSLKSQTALPPRLTQMRSLSFRVTAAPPERIPSKSKWRALDQAKLPNRAHYFRAQRQQSKTGSVRLQFANASACGIGNFIREAVSNELASMCVRSLMLFKLNEQARA